MNELRRFTQGLKGKAIEKLAGNIPAPKVQINGIESPKDKVFISQREERISAITGTFLWGLRMHAKIGAVAERLAERAESRRPGAKIGIEVVVNQAVSTDQTGLDKDIDKLQHISDEVADRWSSPELQGMFVRWVSATAALDLAKKVKDKKNEIVRDDAKIALRRLLLDGARKSTTVDNLQLDETWLHTILIPTMLVSDTSEEKQLAILNEYVNNIPLYRTISS